MVDHSYDELEWHLKRLCRAAGEGKLVFLLGAGVSTSYGLPDWRRLLIALMEETGRLRLPRRASDAFESRLGEVLSAITDDPLLQAEAARTAYDGARRWTATVKEKLTAKDTDVTSTRGNIVDIAELVAGQYRADSNRHVAVLTFNYDDLLERALRLELSMQANIHVIGSADAWKTTLIDEPGIFIFHLHGVITEPDSALILDAGSYVELLRAPANHWSWDCMKRYLFSWPHSGAILLGLSLTDPSVRLLLTEAASKQSSLSALFVTNPFPSLPPSDPPDLTLDRDLAYVARDMQTLLDEALATLSLVPYHVSEWAEVREILQRVKP